MAKSKYKVGLGLAQIITTGEPVYVEAIFNEQDLEGHTETYAWIIRPLVSANGIEHKSEKVKYELLETRFEQAKRNVEFEQFVQVLREEADNKRYALPPPAAALLEAQPRMPKGALIPFNGDGDKNG